jgi:predicted RNA-binding Zn-ribbon protein involved in translation (DUF1610 family)
MAQYVMVGCPMCAEHTVRVHGQGRTLSGDSLVFLYKCDTCGHEYARVFTQAELASPEARPK